LPGTIPMDHVNPPHAPSDDLLLGTPPEPKLAAPAPAAPATRVASAAPNEPSGGFFSALARKVGLGGAAADTTATASPPPQQPGPTKPKVVDAKHPDPSAPKSAKPDTKQAAAKPALKPSVTDTPSTAAAPAPAVQSSVVAGAQPIVSSNSFDNRFSAVK
jgi:outer membrane biosynthesis protein TonB